MDRGRHVVVISGGKDVGHAMAHIRGAATEIREEKVNGRKLTSSTTQQALDVSIQTGDDEKTVVDACGLRDPFLDELE
jgi:predicted thioesterase